MWNTGAGGSTYFKQETCPGARITLCDIHDMNIYLYLYVKAEVRYPSTQPSIDRPEIETFLGVLDVGRPPRLDKPIRLTMIGRTREGLTD